MFIFAQEYNNISIQINIPIILYVLMLCVTTTLKQYIADIYIQKTDICLCKIW